MSMISYGFSKTVDSPFREVLEKAKDELQKEAFGILTTIDVKEKFKEKLGIEFKEYIILGTCNPPPAFKAIESEENIGLMLPCNVIVYGRDDKTVVSVIKPTVAMQMIGNRELTQVAENIEHKLKNAFESI